MYVPQIVFGLKWRRRQASIKPATEVVSYVLTLLDDLFI
jgi:hypothetical protein